MTDHPELLLVSHGLDSCVSDGIRVGLLWNEPDDRVLVSVVDHRMGHAFTLPVRWGRRALDLIESQNSRSFSRGGRPTYMTRCRGSWLISRRPA